MAENDIGLLAAIGRESAGALSFWPEGESPRENKPGYESLSLEEFQAWREFAHQHPLQFHGQTLRLSLAGAVRDALPQVTGSVLDEHPAAGRAAEALRAGVTTQLRMALNS